VHLDVKFEDGDAHTYPISQLVPKLVPFSQLSEAELGLVQNKALQAELAARLRSKQGAKSELARRLYLEFATDEEADAAAAERPQESQGAASGDNGAPAGAEVDPEEDVAALAEAAVAGDQVSFNAGQQKELNKLTE
jgi:hypothetical protein